MSQPHQLPHQRLTDALSSKPQPLLGHRIQNQKVEYRLGYHHAQTLPGRLSFWPLVLNRYVGVSRAPNRNWLHRGYAPQAAQFQTSLGRDDCHAHHHQRCLLWLGCFRSHSHWFLDQRILVAARQRRRPFLKCAFGSLRTECPLAFPTRLAQFHFAHVGKR